MFDRGPVPQGKLYKGKIESLDQARKIAKLQEMIGEKRIEEDSVTGTMKEVIYNWESVITDMGKFDEYRDLDDIRNLMQTKDAPRKKVQRFYKEIKERIGWDNE